MDGAGFLIIIAVALWLISRHSGHQSGTSRTQSPTRPTSPQGSSRTVPSVTSSSITSNSQFRVVTTGHQPSDRCICGGSWIKRENSDTGGRFFSCSRFPSCSYTRDQVERIRLGAKYKDFYCSHGHHKPSGGTVTDPVSGQLLCKKCLDKGYVHLKTPRAQMTPRPTPSIPSRPSVTGQTSRSASDRGEVCRNGHPRTPDNLYIRPDGSRECRICRRNARR